MNDVELQIARLVVKPGDVVVVKCARPVTAHVVRHIEARVCKVLPQGAKVLVIDSDISISVVDSSAIVGVAA